MEAFAWAFANSANAVRSTGTVSASLRSAGGPGSSGPHEKPACQPDAPPTRCAPLGGRRGSDTVRFSIITCRAGHGPQGSVHGGPSAARNAGLGRDGDLPEGGAGVRGGRGGSPARSAGRP